jgi:hypothetical protein
MFEEFRKARDLYVINTFEEMFNADEFDDDDCEEVSQATGVEPDVVREILEATGHYTGV